jgi:anti-sigma factor RsiW
VRGITHGEITAEDLFAFIDGEASPAVAAHLAACPICSARATEYARLQNALVRRLYRFDCPPAAILAAFVAGILPPRERAGVTAHVRACPCCAADVAQLRAAQDEGP